ncbi:GntR family transcriptional regulator [Gryllotalpicola koreensis]|uniref:GntR family transcriptional regulator n=1 Tax=Gryllotalpicola koreensis TaxID=993086 RepID=A0ABP7ZRG7_9MICO
MSSAVAVPTDSGRAAERAYDYTKNAIIRGELEPSAMISENLVCEALGISRTPAHEAFLRLEVEGFLTLASRKGAVVRPMSPQEALDVLEMREAVESSAAARVIAEGRHAELAERLDELLTAQGEALDAGDLDRYVAVDDDFHHSVVVAARNPIAIQFAGVLHDRQQRLRHQLYRVAPDQIAAALGQHRQLAAAIGAGDAAAYRAVLFEHVSLHRGVL